MLWRSHIATALFALLAAIAFGTGPVHANGVDELKSNVIWRHCEHYFLTVEHYKASQDHYAIRDVSIEFVRTIKRFEPGTEREEFLYSECVNLASGNATRAHDAIQREQKEDRAFFEMARIDAENNSNASRFGYVQPLENRRDLDLEVELAKDTFRNLQEIDRSSAARPFGQMNGSVSGGSGSVDFSFNGSGTSNPFAALFLFANWIANGPYSSPSSSAGSGTGSGGGGGGLSTAQSHGSSNTKIAPITPATGTAASAPNGSAPSSGVATTGSLTASAAPKLAPNAVLEPAQHLAPGCASYSVTDADVTLARVINQCDEPIVFHWCWLPNGESDCSPNLLSSVIAGQQSETIPGPEENEQTVAVYVVCDMSNRQRICLN